MPYKMLYNTAQALRPSQATKTCLLMELRKKSYITLIHKFLEFNFEVIVIKYVLQQTCYSHLDTFQIDFQLHIKEKEARMQHTYLKQPRSNRVFQVSIATYTVRIPKSILGSRPVSASSVSFGIPTNTSNSTLSK